MDCTKPAKGRGPEPGEEVGELERLLAGCRLDLENLERTVGRIARLAPTRGGLAVGQEALSATADALADQFRRNVRQIEVDLAYHRLLAERAQRVALHRKPVAAQVPHVRAALGRHARAEAADRQNDALVYELYGLTHEEILIVDETTP